MIRSLLGSLLLLAILPVVAKPGTVLVIEFQNQSSYSDLNWVGESISGKLMTEFASNGEIVLSRAERAEGERRLNLRARADYTEATLIRLGQTLDANTVCFGSFTISLPSPDAALKQSTIRITAEFLDLHKMHLGPEISETGSLSDLSRLEEHLAYESLRYLNPGGRLQLAQFIDPQKTVKLEAEESYVRGLLSNNRDQRQKWFLQATVVDNKFFAPDFELGKLSLEQKQYRDAITWFQHVPPADPNYMEAQFKLGIAEYDSGDYGAAVAAFRTVAQNYPVSEVFNDLGAAEGATGDGAAVEDFRRALESDPHGSTYLFNLGLLLLKAGSFDEAAKCFQQILQHSDDTDARALLDRARKKEPVTPADKLPQQRLKNSFNQTAFRQLKAMLSAK